MRYNDLLILLKNFSKNEVKAFHAYLKKRLKADGISLRLFKFLRMHHPEFDPSKVTFEKAYQYAFQRKVYNKKLLLNELSDLRKLLKDYLVDQELSKDNFTYQLLLHRAYKRYQVDGHSEKQLKTLDQELDEIKLEDATFWYRRMIVAYERFAFESSKNVNARFHLYKAMEYLDMFYAARKWKYSTEIFNIHQIINEEAPDISLLDAIEKELRAQSYIYHSFYHLAMKMIRDRDESLFFELKESFFNRSHEIPPIDRFIILSYLLNHTAYEVLKGKEIFERESLMLAKFGFEHEIFMVPGFIYPNHFVNAIDVAGKLKEEAWAEAIIDKWNEKLPLATRMDYTILSKAILYFQMEKFDKCLEELKDADIKAPENKLRGRWLYIVASYENEEDINHIEYRCDAFEGFVRRNKLIHQNRKKGVLLSIKIMRMLLKQNPKKDRILDLLAESDDFHYKSWLKRKAEQL